MFRESIGRVGLVFERIKFWWTLSFVALFIVALYARVVSMVQLGFYEHVILVSFFILGTVLLALFIQVGALSIGELFIWFDESARLKNARLELNTKELDYRETKPEKVILLELTNRERTLDANQVEVTLSNVLNIDSVSNKELEQLSHEVSIHQYKLMPKNIDDQKSGSLKLRRRDTKEFCFLETNKGRDEFYIKIDTLSKRDNIDIVGGFPPGNYEIGLKIRGSMPKRLIWWYIDIVVFYNGKDQLYIKEVRNEF